MLRPSHNAEEGEDADIALRTGHEVDVRHLLAAIDTLNQLSDLAVDLRHTDEIARGK